MHIRIDPSFFFTNSTVLPIVNELGVYSLCLVTPAIDSLTHLILMGPSYRAPLKLEQFLVTNLF